MPERGKTGWLLRKWRSLYYRQDLGFVRALGLAAICVGISLAGRLLLGLFGPTLAYAAFFPAIVVATLIGGWRAGLSSILLSIAAVWLLGQPPFAVMTAEALAASNLMLFSLTSVLVVGVTQFHRRIVFEMEELERERVLLAQEILHRSKNQAAIIASLVRRSVSDKREAERLIGRISAIADTENLLAPTGAPPLELRALLERVVRRLQGDQVQFTGPDVILSSEQAKALSLAFHEMMTNASKYGGLSSATGRVEITWTDTAAGPRIVWQECVAPALPPTTSEGFGLTLIKSALDQIGAELTIDRGGGGYRYDIVLPR